jgi:hypothetical protein
MQRILAVLALALTLSPLPLAAEAPTDPEFTLGQYQAMPLADRTFYIAGLSEMLEAAAAMAPSNDRMPAVAHCTGAYARDSLVAAAEAGSPDIKHKWSEHAPAAEWFFTTMTHVCKSAPAAGTADPRYSLDSFAAMEAEQSMIYVAGLADMLDLAATLAPDNSRLPVLADCTHGFGRDQLLSALEAGGRENASNWTGDAPAAVWFIDTMIYVCQLQLSPLQP